jgi:hypothetical protein
MRAGKGGEAWRTRRPHQLVDFRSEDGHIRNPGAVHRLICSEDQIAHEQDADLLTFGFQGHIARKLHVWAAGEAKAIIAPMQAFRLRANAETAIAG